MLVQAWKKTHDYLRTKSWFADVLELDLSAVDLKRYVDALSSEIRTGPDAFTPSPIRLVPAPKSDEHPWFCSHDSWSPGKETKPFTRPLAHLTLRDQILATAIMICVADYVETAQGDCDVTTLEARKARVSSYGNRLLCDWTTNNAKEARAEFTWGNTSTYRRYFSDYRAFLRRPLEVGRQHYSMKSEEAELGVVSLDLQGFYDGIQPSRVIEALKAICKEQGAPVDAQFWKAVKKCFAWKWDPVDKSLKSLLKSGSLPRGLPQGLVSAGFLSNAYMVAFDRAVTQRVKGRRAASGDGWQVIDFCRYVDDIRLVVVGESVEDSTKFKKAITDWFRGVLNEHIGEQQCNQNKTAYVSQEEIESRTVRPTLMAAIQEKLSGPADLETLEHAGFALDGLLNTVGDGDHVEADDGSSPTAEPLLALSHIHFAKHSVRDDTVVRFAAYRKLTSLRARRYFLAAEDGQAASLAMKRIDAEIEISARRMIRLWSRDPSLAIVLRHALNLYPTPELLEPVIEALRYALTGKGTDRKLKQFRRAVALFTAGELFKAGVTETGIDVASVELPEKSDLNGYRDALADFAAELLGSAETPWYVTQQAILFLLSVGRIPSSADLDGKDVGDNYRELVRIASGSQATRGRLEAEVVSLILVLDQLGNDRSSTLSRLRRVFSGSSSEDQKTLGEQLYLANPTVAVDFLRYLKTKRSHDIQYASLLAAFPGDVIKDKHSTKDLTKQSKLSELMNADDNPFVQETAALQLLRKLAEALLDQTISVDDLHPSGVRLSTDSPWAWLKNPRRRLSLTVRRISSAKKDPRYVTPDWAEGDRADLYALGRLIRAAVIGKGDFTSTGFQLNQFRDGYHGLRSSWFKRQHGLSNDLTISEWEPSSCSPWLASLVMHLLSWPGCRKDPEGEFTGLKTVGDLLGVVKERLKRLKSIYGRGSNLPIYEVDVKHTPKEPPIVSMALLQTARPTHEDVRKHGPELSSDQFRPVHRSHLASMLRIAADHIDLRSTYDKKPHVDITVLPEISVHRDDIDLLERFADATQAIVFCGLSFWHHHGRGGLVNSGLWIIPEHRRSGRSFRYLLQGKEHLTPGEDSMKILSHRPHQYLLRLNAGDGLKPFVISGAICFDATDLQLASDLRDQSDMLIVAANNKDVPTFDTMATALSWHMFQHIVIVNTGEFGGSVVNAPYKEKYQRVLKHDHGGHQAAISIVETDLSDYQRMREKSPKELKSPPAGFSRH